MQARGTRGYVYLGGYILAVQQNNEVSWIHQDPVAKSKRVTDGSGNIVSTLELDPWGGETDRSSNSAFQPRRFTTYERDGNLSDEAMHRRYNRWHSRFDQPDPYGGSYDITDPQSFNRYAYVQNDPVNFVDPSGLYKACVHEAMTKFLAKLSGRYSDEQAAALGRFAGDAPGGADSRKYSATNPINIFKSFIGRGPSARVHFASNATLEKEKGRFSGYIATEDYQKAGFVLHSIEDVRGAHDGHSLPLGHAFKGSKPDRIIGDAKFMRAANEVFQLLSGNKNASLSFQQKEDLINAIISGCGEKAKDLLITETVPIVGGGVGSDIGAISLAIWGGGAYDPFGWLYMLYEMEKREWEQRQPR